MTNSYTILKCINLDKIFPIFEDMSKKRRVDGCDEALPSPVKHRRSNRATHVDALSYDLKHHPLDIVTRPKAFLKKLNTQLGDSRRKSRSSNNDRNNGSLPEDNLPSDKELDDIPQDVAERKVLPNRALLTVNLNENVQHCRRSSRLSSSNSGRPLYDMSWHPADHIIRPQAAAARQKRVKQLKGARLNNDDRDFALAGSGEESENAFEEEANYRSSSISKSQSSESNQIIIGKPTNIKSRRSSRARPDGPLPNYSASFHPADVILRPSAAAKHLASQPGQPLVPIPSISPPLTSLKAETPLKRQSPKLRPLAAKVVPSELALVTPHNGGEPVSQVYNHSRFNNSRSFRLRKQFSSKPPQYV